MRSGTEKTFVAIKTENSRIINLPETAVNNLKSVSLPLYMAGIKILRYKNHLTNYLLTVSLFFSSLIFSGYSNTLNTLEQQVVTAWQVSSSAKAGKLNAPYVKISHLTKSIREHRQANQVAVAEFNRLLKIQFDKLANKHFITHTRIFYHHKIIPQHADEDALGIYSV